MRNTALKLYHYAPTPHHMASFSILTYKPSENLFIISILNHLFIHCSKIQYEGNTVLDLNE